MSNKDQPNPIPSSPISPPQTILGHQKRKNALKLGPRKKVCIGNPLVHRGCHFGRMVHALCNINALITNSILQLGELADEPEESFTAEEQQEHQIFSLLLITIPSLEEHLMTSSLEEIRFIGELIQKGVSCARSDDTKSLKSAIIDWIAPPGQSISPTISQNVKRDHGFYHKIMGSLLCPAGLNWSDEETKKSLRDSECTIAGDQWPLLLYKDSTYDPKNPWHGSFKHIFTSPSSAKKEAKATQSGNAHIHGMACVTNGSLAYAATQARFALTSCPTFTRSDTVTDLERFYNSVLDFLEDPDEQEEVKSLMVWWNRQIFPSSLSGRCPITNGSALAKMQEKRVVLKVLAQNREA
ncbi:hypothetical protein BDZ94DRAFT_1179339 [Collybia nuda]|uniref:Uncharacterized protein n=1 Tax=Collybia nuda TaxID=64659 RepID=A0A9P5XSG3_9AGAR|nr:hypothetical protein BDZ94DRAFT_1179339 [Collybia nuda]